METTATPTRTAWTKWLVLRVNARMVGPVTVSLAQVCSYSIDTMEEYLERGH